MAYTVDEAIKNLEKRQEELLTLDALSYSDEDWTAISNEIQLINNMLTELNDNDLLGKGKEGKYDFLNRNTDVLKKVLGEDFEVSAPKGDTDVVVDENGDLRWSEDAIMSFYGVPAGPNGKYSDKQKMDFFTNIAPKLETYNKNAYKYTDGKKELTAEGRSMSDDRSIYAKNYMREKAFTPSEQESFGEALKAGIAKYMFPTLWQAAKDGQYDNAESKSDLLDKNFGRDYLMGVTYGLTPSKYISMPFKAYPAVNAAIKTGVDASLVPVGWNVYDVAKNDKPIEEAAFDATVGTLVNATYPRYVNKQANKATSKVATAEAIKSTEQTAVDYLERANAMEKALKQVNEELNAGKQFSKESIDFLESHKGDGFFDLNVDNIYKLFDMTPEQRKEVLRGLEYDIQHLRNSAKDPELVKTWNELTLNPEITPASEAAKFRSNDPVYGKNFNTSSLEKVIADNKLARTAGKWIDENVPEKAKPWITPPTAKQDVTQAFVNAAFNRGGDNFGDAAISHVPFVSSWYDDYKDDKAQEERNSRIDLLRQKQEQLARRWRYENKQYLSPEVAASDAKIIEESFKNAQAAKLNGDKNWMNYIEPGFENLYNMWEANKSIKQIKIK